MAKTARKARRKNRHPETGKIRLTRAGYGFVSTSAGEYFILPGRLNGAMDGDTVEVRWLKAEEQRRNRRMGSISYRQNSNAKLGSVTRVLERGRQSVVGRLTEKDGLRVVRPLDQRVFHDVFIDTEQESLPAKDQDIVIVRLTGWPSRLEAATGYIEEVVGEADEPGILSEIIYRRHGIKTVFSDAAIRQVGTLASDQTRTLLAEYLADIDSQPWRLPETPTEILKRHDLTDLITFTIDPIDAHDFDDALSVEFIDGQLQLGVHIADVSAFVGLDSALDVEARLRGTSVYLPDRVVPMLPFELSADLCSLKPGEVRLAFSVMMTIDTSGVVLSTEFYPSIIRSAARLDYDQVDCFLSSTEQTASDEPGDISPDIGSRLVTLDRLARRLKSQRIKRGAIDFATEEAKVILDGSGLPTQVILRTGTAATSLVEEAMILANEQVAAWMLANGAPMVYRIHEPPVPLALQEAFDMLYQLGLIDTVSMPSEPGGIQTVLQSTENRPEFFLISNILLRVMKRASYADFFSEHYGLASKAYCHFTSPIRRYPDLLVHHLLKLQLAGVVPPVELTRTLGLLAKQATAREEAAEAVTREATNLKLVEFLSTRVGEVFPVIISGVAGYGLFVKELQTTAEGFISRESLSSRFVYEPDAWRYVDQNGMLTLPLGQIISARLVKADIFLGELNFEAVFS